MQFRVFRGEKFIFDIATIAKFDAFIYLLLITWDI